MISELKKPEIQQFIQDHLYDDPATLMLKASDFSGVPMAEVVAQIQAKRKAKNKLPEWFSTEGLIYPPKVSMEQCSSELTARYKASLTRGHSMADITGGFGIDTFYLAQNFEKADYVERSQDLADIAAHNFNQLGAAHIQTKMGDGLNYLRSIEVPLSLIYIDPARRGDFNQKVFRLEDCEPNVFEHLDLLLEKAETLMIKASPMLDIKLALSALGGASEVHVVSVQNELKELLFVLKGNREINPTIHCINLKSNEDAIFTFDYELEADTEVQYSAAKEYLFEPNASIMKAGAFNAVASAYELNKLHPNSHLYTSDNLNRSFPGRVFKVLRTVSMNKKELKRVFPEGKVNITNRNFPMSVAQIRKKTGLKDGGNEYLVVTRDQDGPKIFHCHRL